MEKYIIEDKKIKQPNCMSDTQIIVILIQFHYSYLRYFKHYYKEYICKHLFIRQVS